MGRIGRKSPIAAERSGLGPTLIALQPGRTQRSHSPRSGEGVVARHLVFEPGKARSWLSHHRPLADPRAGNGGDEERMG
jgi:hypothetical protein